MGNAIVAADAAHQIYRAYKNRPKRKRELDATEKNKVKDWADELHLNPSYAMATATDVINGCYGVRVREGEPIDFSVEQWCGPTICPQDYPDAKLKPLVKPGKPIEDSMWQKVHQELKYQSHSQKKTGGPGVLLEKVPKYVSDCTDNLQGGAKLQPQVHFTALRAQAKYKCSPAQAYLTALLAHGYDLEHVACFLLVHVLGCLSRILFAILWVREHQLRASVLLLLAKRDLSGVPFLLEVAVLDVSQLVHIEANVLIVDP